VLKNATAGVHCTLHGAIMQLSLGRPAFAFESGKFRDATANSPLAGFELPTTPPDSSAAVLDAIARADEWAARLRATKTDDNLLLLKINMGAGHGGLQLSNAPDVGRRCGRR
jgi:hypothetical protein